MLQHYSNDDVTQRVLKPVLFSSCFVSNSLGHSAVGFWWREVMKAKVLVSFSLKNGRMGLKGDCNNDIHRNWEI